MSLERVPFDVARAHHRGGHLGVRHVHDPLPRERAEHAEAALANSHREARGGGDGEALLVQDDSEVGDAVKEAYHEIELNHPELRGGDPAGHHRQRAEGERLEAVPVAEELADDGVVLEVRVAELAYGLNGKENWCNPGVG